ncbi:insecticidal delta-endotoxin Cry8Ea1 family protein [Bacillus cereus]|nr:insecticidal delta-endotoxin Cry8Ea1 family protein [Bacillus cereus]
MEYRDKKMNTAQQVTSNSLGASGGAAADTPPNIAEANKILLDKIIDKLKDQKVDGQKLFEGNKYFTADTMKAINSLGGLALKQIYTNAYSKDFNNASRELAVGITALIPYAGVIISPLLGLLWPENTSDSQMQKVEQKIQDEIKGYDLSAIKSDYKTLVGLQQKFEKSMIEKNINKGTRRNDAINVDNKFESLINDCAKDTKLEEVELPLYTMIAAAHLAFLQSMQQEQTRLDANIDDGTFNSHFNTLAESTKNYRNHIKETYEKKHKSVINEIDNIGKRHDVKIDENNYENALQQKIKDLNGYIRTLGDRSGAWTKEIEQIKKDIATCDKSLNDLRDFYNQTWGNKAFQMTARLDMWIEEKGKWYRYDENGQMKIGWFKNGNRYYYLSAEKNKKFEKGQMVIGWLDDKGERYYLSPEKKDGFEEGQMVTGLVKIEGKTFYFDPSQGYIAHPTITGGWHNLGQKLYYFNTEKNTKFEKGQMVTGWKEFNKNQIGLALAAQVFVLHMSDALHKIEEIKKQPADTKFWMYFNSDGQFISNTKQTIDGKIYKFDKFGVCLNP